MGTTESRPKRQRLTDEQRIAQYEQRIQQIKAKKAKRSRQLETREKIVIGSAVVAACRDDAALRQQIAGILKERVTRDIDREVIAEWLSATSMSE